MAPSQMRAELKRLYGPNWAEKVNAMSDKQVVAIYIKFKLQNKI